MWSALIPALALISEAWLALMLVNTPVKLSVNLWRGLGFLALPAAMYLASNPWVLGSTVSLVIMGALVHASMIGVAEALRAARSTPARLSQLRPTPPAMPKPASLSVNAKRRLPPPPRITK